jgi:hypothetical protein
VNALVRGSKLRDARRTRAPCKGSAPRRMCCRRGARAWIHVAPTPILRSWHMCTQMTGRCSARNPQSKAALVVCAPVKGSIADVARSTRSSMRPKLLASSGTKMARSWLVMAASPNLETMLMSRGGGGGGVSGFEAGCGDRIIDGARDGASSATGVADLYSRSFLEVQPPARRRLTPSTLGKVAVQIHYNFMKLAKPRFQENADHSAKLGKMRETGDTDCVLSDASRNRPTDLRSAWHCLLALLFSRTYRTHVSEICMAPPPATVVLQRGARSVHTRHYTTIG